MRLILLPLIAFSAATSLQAGPVHVCDIHELENAPLLVVATVESLTKEQPVPPAQTRSKLPEQYWEARLRVHRAYSMRPLPASERIRLRYIYYGDSHGGGIRCPPAWPHFENGQTALFALTPRRGTWRLITDEGRNLTVPAIVSGWLGAPARTDGRAFILGELANTLANGTAAARYDAAVYLRDARIWPGGLRELVEMAAGGNGGIWMEIACALVACVGVPHPSIAELIAKSDWPDGANKAAAWALAKTRAQDRYGRLIRCLLRNMPAYDWGAANRLAEFKDSALVVRGMSDALARDPGGSIYAAWRLVSNGQRAFLREALDAAVMLAGNPQSVPMGRLQAASALLRDYGSEEQFDIIPATLRRLKYTNEDAYRRLSGSVDYMQSRRELRIAGVLIDDRRVGFPPYRYCDLATATVEKFSGESFGMRNATTAEDRDRAVARAAAWLRNNRDSL